ERDARPVAGTEPALQAIADGDPDEFHHRRSDSRLLQPVGLVYHLEHAAAGARLAHPVSSPRASSAHANSAHRIRGNHRKSPAAPAPSAIKRLQGRGRTRPAGMAGWQSVAGRTTL